MVHLQLGDLVPSRHWRKEKRHKETLNSDKKNKVGKLPSILLLEKRHTGKRKTKSILQRM